MALEQTLSVSSTQIPVMGRISWIKFISDRALAFYRILTTSLSSIVCNLILIARFFKNQKKRLAVVEGEMGVGRVGYGGAGSIV